MAEKVLQMIADLTEIFDEEYGMRHLITPENTAQKLIDKGYRKLSADVVVRCKDCRHFCEIIGEVCFCSHKYGLNGKIHRDGYCSYGERKSGK